jgi:hypothetical protein
MYIYRIQGAAVSPRCVQQTACLSHLAHPTTGNLVTWTALSLTATSSSLSFCVWLRLVLYCEHSFPFSWFCMTYVCYLHNRVIWNTYSHSEATCNSRTDMRLAKLPMMRWSLPCKRCSSNRGRLRQVCYWNSEREPFYTKTAQRPADISIMNSSYTAWEVSYLPPVTAHLSGRKRSWQMLRLSTYLRRNTWNSEIYQTEQPP